MIVIERFTFYPLPAAGSMAFLAPITKSIPVDILMAGGTFLKSEGFKFYEALILRGAVVPHCGVAFLT